VVASKSILCEACGIALTPAMRGDFPSAPVWSLCCRAGRGGMEGSVDNRAKRAQACHYFTSTVMKSLVKPCVTPTGQSCDSLSRQTATAVFTRAQSVSFANNYATHLPLCDNIHAVRHQPQPTYPATRSCSCLHTHPMLLLHHTSFTASSQTTTTPCLTPGAASGQQMTSSQAQSTATKIPGNASTNN